MIHASSTEDNVKMVDNVNANFLHLDLHFRLRMAHILISTVNVNLDLVVHCAKSMMMIVRVKNVPKAKLVLTESGPGNARIQLMLLIVPQTPARTMANAWKQIVDIGKRLKIISCRSCLKCI